MGDTRLGSTAHDLVPPDGEVTSETALRLAKGLIVDQDFASAKLVLERIIAVAPDYSDALNVLAIVCNYYREHEKARELLERAAELDPENAIIQNNLGNILVATDEPEAAVEAFKRSVKLDRSYSDPIYNLHSIMIDLKQVDDAETLLRHALKLSPNMGIAHKSLAMILVKRGREKEALKHFLEAVKLLSVEQMSPQLMVFAYERNGMHEEAVEFTRRWAEIDPKSPEPAHILAALTGDHIPPRASDGFVERVFDRFADSFDAKLAKLQYHAPDLVGATLTHLLGDQVQAKAILDAGCGTGLCGKFARPYARLLTGVDLSSKMLEKAEKLKFYDELIQGELTAYIEMHPRRFDVIISADTLCYFGRLDEFAAVCFRALCDGGALIFTVEELGDDDGNDFKLVFNGRYQHGERYVRNTLEDAGLTVSAVARETLRLENLEPVRGLVVTATKHPAQP